MMADVNAGARIVRVIAVLTSVPLTAAALLAAALGRPVPVQGWVSVVVSLAMAWLMVQGSQWARGWIITGLALSGVAAAILGRRTFGLVAGRPGIL